MMIMENKEYKIIEAFGRELKVYENGEIWSPLFIQTNGKILKSKRKAESTKRAGSVDLGYKSVGFRSGGIVRRVSVHRLVARAWLDDWDESLTVDHIDGNKDNNDASNLRMVTTGLNTRLHFSRIDKSGVSYNCFNVVEYASGKFRASLRADNRTVYSKMFSSRMEAAQSANSLCIKHSLPIGRFNTPLKCI